MKRLILLALPLLASGCITYHTNSDGITRAHLGESVVVDGPWPVSVAAAPLGRR